MISLYDYERGHHMYIISLSIWSVTSQHHIIEKLLEIDVDRHCFVWLRSLLRTNQPVSQSVTLFKTILQLPLFLTVIMTW